MNETDSINFKPSSIQSMLSCNQNFANIISQKHLLKSDNKPFSA